MNTRALIIISTSATVRSALWMTVSAICAAVMICLVRIGAEELHPFQLVFFRNLFGVLLLLPWLLHVGKKGLKTNRMGLYSVRACIGVSALLSWFYALSVMPVVEAVALSFTVPLFTTIASPLFLGEVVGPRRWMATVIGFLGVLIVLRPGADAVQPAALIVLVSSVFLAGVVLAAKTLARTEPSGTILFYNMLLLTPLSLVPALFVWQWPSGEVLVLLLGIAAASTLDHVGFTRALKLADATVIIPFDYLRLPLVAVLSYLLFSEMMDGWSWIGALVIAGATLEISYREAMAESRRCNEKK